MDEREKFGRRLAEARWQAGFTQAGLGSAIGRTGQAVSQWETGKADPSLSLLRAAAKVCNVDAAWLAFGTQPEKSYTAVVSGLVSQMVRAKREGRTEEAAECERMALRIAGEA